MILGAVGFPASICAFFAWPMTMLAVMLAFDLEPSGEWDAATIGANVANVIVMGGASLCMTVSPVLVMGGLAMWFAADREEKKQARDARL